MNITKSPVTVFNVEPKEKCVRANISEGSKIKGTDEYENWSWQGAVFVGDACEKAKNLKNKDRITILDARISNPAAKDKNGEEKLVNGKKVFYPNLVILDFELGVDKFYEELNNKNKDKTKSKEKIKEPQQSEPEESEDDLPF